MRPGLRRCRSLGAWLSLLALYVQVSLPLLIATELRIAEAGTLGLSGYAICGSGNPAVGFHHRGAPDGTDTHSRSCCPLCAVAGTPYIASGEIFIPVPAEWSIIRPRATTVVALGDATTRTYRARAPPLNG